MPLDTPTMLRAAGLWAEAQQIGQPTADPKKLDIDVILAAQVLAYAEKRGIVAEDVIVATSNVSHLSCFIKAASWREIIE